MFSKFTSPFSKKKRESESMLLRRRLLCTLAVVIYFKAKFIFSFWKRKGENLWHFMENFFGHSAATSAWKFFISNQGGIQS